MIYEKSGYNCQKAMKPYIETHFRDVIQHLYINPLERCNLRCKICYTRKTSPKLEEEQILDFVKRYREEVMLKVITFCGGEVMLLPYFPHLVNVLTQMGVYIQIITNGTIDRLSEFSSPQLVNLIVSIDGLEQYHDSNRGTGNFSKSITMLKEAKMKGFHTEIFSIVTCDNFDEIAQFEEYIEEHVGNTEITYHPRKPPEYLTKHPVSNIEGVVKGFGYVTGDQLKSLYKTKKVFPPPDLGCYQISLVSDGKVYGCCEGTKPIGTINDDISVLIANLHNRIEEWEKGNRSKTCLGCSQSDFMCGMKQFLCSYENNS
jgi:MoaA/NifB/PqqE/SkfB family radical SAM enzyme